MIPGTQPQRVKMNTIIKDPHPLSTTANGGNKIESKTRQILMLFYLNWFTIIGRILVNKVTIPLNFISPIEIQTNVIIFVIKITHHYYGATFRTRTCTSRKARKTT